MLSVCLSVCLLRSVVIDYSCCHFFQNGSTPFHWAAANCHLDVVDELLSAGANINAADNVRTIIYICMHTLCIHTISVCLGYLERINSAVVGCGPGSPGGGGAADSTRGRSASSRWGECVYLLIPHLLWEVGRGCSTLAGLYLLYIGMIRVVWC